MGDKIKEYLKDYIQGDSLNIPCEAVAERLSKKIHFTIKAIISNDLIRLSTGRLDFGIIYKNCSKVLPLSFKNDSLLI